MIPEGGVLATVKDPGGTGGNIQVVAGGKLLARNWWAIVLRGIGKASRMET